MSDDRNNRLIAEYDACRSDEAFGALVRQHINLVFATALRQVGDAGAAEEIAQNVFVTLAQASGKLRSHPTIAGWLHQTTLNKSRAWLRSELRRRHREQAAFDQQLTAAEGDSVWSPLVPLLDEALLKLREPDRLAVIMHFMEGQTFEEVGTALGLGEDTARKRVNRCLHELTHFFQRRGFAVPALTAATPLFALASHTAPAGLAPTVITAGLAAAHSAASASTLTLVKGALKIMAWTKTQTIVAATVAVLLATSATVIEVKKAMTPSVDESYWALTTRNLDRAPAVLIIRPARYSDNGAVCRNFNSDAINQIISHNSNIAGLMEFAYSYYSPPDPILPDGVPTNNYDLMLTLRRHSLEALQKAIRQKFGLVAHRETMETNALCLTVTDPKLLALHASKSGSKRMFKNGKKFVFYSNSPISLEAQYLELFFYQRVVLQPGLSGSYDITYQWHSADTMQQEISNELARAGLQLVPTNMPIEVLVVEKAN